MRDVDRSKPFAGDRARRSAEGEARVVLDAANQAFTEWGLSLTLQDVATYAGLDEAAVRCRYPNKHALIDALFEDRLDALAGIARDGLEHDDPWEGLTLFMERSPLLISQDRALGELLYNRAHGEERIDRMRSHMAPVIGALFDRARAAGQLRPDVDTRDQPVLQTMLITAVEFCRDVEPEVWRRYLTIILDGLRARPQSTELPVPALDGPQLKAAFAAWRAPRYWGTAQPGDGPRR